VHGVQPGTGPQATACVADKNNRASAAAVLLPGLPWGNGPGRSKGKLGIVAEASKLQIPSCRHIGRKRN
jgi:hypothetical protein